MKNKKLLYILLPASVIIWGLVIYRIFSALSSPETPDRVILAKNIKTRVNNTQADTFSIAANYRDPFLGSMQTETPKRVASGVVKQKITPQPQIQADWSFIQYKGMVANQQSKKQSKRYLEE